jgi:pimeloyl-ACP methyl ester carboxylesterase
VSSEYVWHDMAQRWQTPEVGEQVMAALDEATTRTVLAANGVPEEQAAECARYLDATMKDCILRLYRSAVDVFREWEPDLAKIRAPGLVLWGAQDPFAAASFADRMGEQTGARKVVKFDCGHWWQCQEPAKAASEIQEFWNQVNA